MWLLTLKPRNPYRNLALSVLLGPVLLAVFAELYRVIGSDTPDTGFNAVSDILDTVMLAQLVGGVTALLFIPPILWLTLRMGFAGPLIALIVGVAPFVLMGFLDSTVILFPLVTIAVFAFSAYLPTSNS